MEKWGIKHILTPPYHPASNGLCEKAVGIVKDKLKKMDAPGSPLELHVFLQVVLGITEQHLIQVLNKHHMNS